MDELPFSINWLAVLVAIIIRMVIGALWYGPLFGKPWIALVGLTEETLEGQGKAMSLAAVVAVVMSIIMATLVDYVNATNVLGGLFTGFFVWLGFVATTQYQLVLFEYRKPSLFLINTGYELSTLLAIGVLLAVWQ